MPHARNSTTVPPCPKTERGSHHSKSRALPSSTSHDTKLWSSCARGGAANGGGPKRQRKRAPQPSSRAMLSTGCALVTRERISITGICFRCPKPSAPKLLLQEQLVDVLYPQAGASQLRTCCFGCSGHFSSRFHRSSQGFQNHVSGGILAGWHNVSVTELQHP